MGPDMSEPVLLVRDLVAGYEPGVPIVRGASITVNKGEIVVVLGPNGAGKSSFIKAIAGLVPVTSGSVVLDGKEITTAPAHSMVRLGLAFVPQTENVFPLMSVEDNLKVAGGILKPKEIPAASRKCMRPSPISPAIAASPPAISRVVSGRCSPSPAP
jgi:branched-chain amino acid transport system ATP-binding protein